MRGFGKDEQEEGQENVQVCFDVVELLLLVCGRCVFEKRGMEKTGGKMTESKPFPLFPLLVFLIPVITPLSLLTVPSYFLFQLQLYQIPCDDQTSRATSKGRGRRRTGTIRGTTTAGI